MMTDAPTGHFQSIVLQPHAGQFVIDELPAIVLCCAAWVYGGMEGLPLTALAVSVAALLSLALLYRFIYLRRTRYHIGSEQLISRHGVLSRKTDYMEQYRIVDFVEHQSLMQQLCGLKTVRIFSMDRNTPRLDLVGIRHNFDVVTLIRERVEYNKRKKGIYLLAELNYKRFMFKKLCILLIFSKLNEIKHLIDKYRMHNLYAIFAKLLNICKQIAGNLVNESGNVPRRGVVPKFSDLEVVALNMASEAVGIDSESLLFANLQEYRVEIPNLISRRQYNDRRKITSSLCNAIRERMVAKMDGGEDYFCIDSKPIEVCRIARSKRCSMGKKDFSKAPGVGYCASQSMYYYGYKLHAVCGLSGVIHSFDLTKASVHDIHYLKDVKVDYSNCTVIGDRGYISAQVQLDLFETTNIRLEVPYRCNQKEWKPTFPAFAKARKRIETIFSQLCDQFMIIRNYAKDTDGLFARIIGKISALTILQYINYKNEKPIGRVKYALF